MELSITIVEVPSALGTWTPLYDTLTPPSRAVQQWHEKRGLLSFRAIYDPRSGFVETTHVRAWSVQVPAAPDRRPWILRALRRTARALTSAMYMLLFGPVRRSDVRSGGRLGSR